MKLRVELQLCRSTLDVIKHGTEDMGKCLWDSACCHMHHRVKLALQATELGRREEYKRLCVMVNTRKWAMQDKRLTGERTLLRSSCTLGSRSTTAPLMTEPVAAAVAGSDMPGAVCGGG